MGDHGDGTKENPFRGPLGMVELVEDAVLKALNFDKLTEDDRNELLWAKRRLRTAVSELEKLLAGQSSDTLRELGRDNLTAALGAAFLAGQSGTTTESGEIHSKIKRNTSAAKQRRPSAESPFTEWIKGKLERNPAASNKDIADALIRNAQLGEDGEFELVGDSETGELVSIDGKRLKISSIPSAISKARKKNSER